MAVKGLFAGSFNPFTYGHLDIVKSASQLFDILYLCIAVNSDKIKKGEEDSETEINKKRKAIEDSIAEAGLTNVKVMYCSGFIAKVCEDLEVDYLVRGLRNTSDYLYEENIAKINSELNPNLKTIYIRGTNDVISSTLIRELLRYGEDISKYVPVPIQELMQSN